MEIVIRALVIFVFLWLVTRAVGRSSLGELSTFELLLYVTMGDLVQQAVTQQDYSVTAAMLAVGTFALLTVLLSWSQWRFPRLRPALTGRPVLVFSDGSPDVDSMRRERLAMADLLVAARQQASGTPPRSSTPSSRPTAGSRSSPMTRAWRTRARRASPRRASPGILAKVHRLG